MVLAWQLHLEGILMGAGADKRVLQEIDSQRDYMIEFLQNLVRIPSPEGGGHEVQEFVARYLDEEMSADEVDVFHPDIEKLRDHPGYTPVFHEHGGTPVEDKPVVMATFRGTGEGRSLMFVGHMEAATPAWEPAMVEEWVHDPWAAVIEGDAMIGKSVSNMKGGNAAYIMAVKAIRDAGICLRGDVLISTNIDEDIGCQGTVEAIRRGYRADAAICPEPSQMKLGIGSPGCQHFRVLVKGNPTYGGGISAIDNAIKVHRAIQELSDYRMDTAVTTFNEQHPELEHRYPLNITIGMFNAGVWPCTTPYEAVIEGSIRHVPGEQIEDVRQQLEDQVKRCANLDLFMRDHPPRVEFWEYWIDHLEDLDEPIVQTVSQAFTEVMGSEPKLSFSVGDAAPLSRFAGVPSIYLGPKAPDESTVPEGSLISEEAISVQSYIDLIKIFAMSIISWCGTG